MITRCIILWVLLIIALQMTAQRIMSSWNRNGELTIQPEERCQHERAQDARILQPFYQLLRTFHIDSMLQHFTPELSTIPDERPLDRQIASSAYLPFFSAYTDAATHLADGARLQRDFRSPDQFQSQPACQRTAIYMARCRRNHLHPSWIVADDRSSDAFGRTALPEDSIRL